MNHAPRTIHQVARSARIRGTRATLVATLALTVALYFAISPEAGVGVLLGGIAGALGFWTMSVRLERVAIVKPDRLALAATIWTYYRLAIYGVFLFIAYRIDPVEMRGFMGGIGGLLVTRIVTTFLAIRDSRAASSKLDS